MLALLTRFRRQSGPVPPRTSRRRWWWLVLVIPLLPVAIALDRAELRAPEPSFYLTDRHGAFLAQIHEDEALGSGYWPLEQLPDRVVAATLALEDRRFYRHPGVDLLAIFRALRQNLTGRHRISGASTLAMQIARMQHPGERGYLRKGMEALTALILTARYGREALLGHYLRLVPYGNRSHGIAHAARLYLDKPVADLSWAEIALLSAIPQSPARMNLFTQSGRRLAMARGQRILAFLHGQGIIPAGDYATAKQQLPTLQPAPRPTRPPEALHQTIRIRDLFQEHRSWAQANDHRLATTLDLPLQKKISRLTRQRLEQWQGAGAEQAAAIVIRLADRAVLAWVGSGGFFTSGQGAIDYARTLRPAGSTLKPFLYGFALDRGVIQANTILPDIAGLPYGIVNSDGRHLGPLLPRQALANSRNVPASDLLRQVGPDFFLLFLRQLGLDHQWLPASHYGLTLAIGSISVTLESLATAYAALADEGRLLPLRWLADQESVPPQPILPPAIARLMALFLSDPQARLPTFARLSALEYDLPVAVKTGTSQGYRDAWTIAYSTRFLVAVWVGRPDAMPMKQMGGSESAAILTHDILNQLHPERSGEQPEATFPLPEGYRQVALCSHSGLRDQGHCSQTFQEWLPAEQEVPSDDTRVEMVVDRRNGLLATPRTPAVWTDRRAFIQLPSRFTEWALHSNFPIPPRQFSLLDLPENELANWQAPPGGNSGQEKGIRLTVLSPQHYRRIFRNPELPPEQNNLVLRATIDPMVPQAVWYVDDQPWQTVAPPYTALWPLAQGRHHLQLKLPYRPEASAKVWIEVE